MIFFVVAALMAACGGGGGAAPVAAVQVATAPVAAAPTASRVGIDSKGKLLQVGQTLYGVYTYADANNDPQGTSTFRWLRSGVAVAGATASTYTLVGADQGNPIIFEVTPVSTVAPTTGAPAASGATAPVTAADPVPAAAAPPTASTVAISGTAQVGQLLTGNYTYADTNNDPQGASTFRWMRNGVAITGATARTYTLVSADQGKTIIFEVTPVSTVAPATGTPATSSPTEAVIGVGLPAAPTASGVAISGMPKVGQVLTGNYTYADANNDLEGSSIFRWLRNGSVAITGATAKTYTLVGDDLGKTITFEVTPVASTGTPASGTLVTSAATALVMGRSVGMKLLVISAEGTLPSYLATLSILDQIGVPYDKMVLKGSNATTLKMEAATLSDGAGNGNYQGIILETGDLAAYNAPTNNYPSAMTAAQWEMLRQYQFAYGVRSATMYTRPAATIDAAGAALDLTYGLTLAAEGTPTDPPLEATFTTAGAQTFSYLNTTSRIAFKGGVYTYRATPTAGTTVSLLQAPDGKSLASVYTAPPVAPATTGWENLALASDNNPELTHTLLLGYGIVNWVTKGLFLGERKIYMSAQPDDVFIPDDLWSDASKTTPGTEAFRWRNDATDYTSLVDWQTTLRANSQTAAFRLELPFNGVGYNTTDNSYLNPGLTAGSYLPDTLSAAVRANPNAFRWINHTWDHTSLDPEGGFTPTVSSIGEQLTWNHEVATGVRSGNPNSPLATKVTFSLYNRNAMVQPDISGLANPVFWQAAQNFGIKYILMDTSKAYAGFNPSRPTVGPISPNTGYTSSLDTSPANNRILIIPRYPTNLFYNVSTPDEWVSEYNHFYAALSPALGGIGYVSDYPQVLNQESEVLVRYMLKYNVNSWMFHAANLRDYDGAGPNKKSVLSDLLDAVVAKFTAMYSLPVLSPSQSEIGAIMEARMAYNAAITGGLKGRIVYGASASIELTNSSSAPVAVPVTGVNVVDRSTRYGGQTISTVPLAAGVSTTIAVP